MLVANKLLEERKNVSFGGLNPKYPSSISFNVFKLVNWAATYTRSKKHNL